MEIPITANVLKKLIFLTRYSIEMFYIFEQTAALSALSMSAECFLISRRLILQSHLGINHPGLLQILSFEQTNDYRKISRAVRFSNGYRMFLSARNLSDIMGRLF